MYIAFACQILCAFTAMHILLVGEPPISFFYLTEMQSQAKKIFVVQNFFFQSQLADFLLFRSQGTFVAGFAAFLWSVSFSVLFL